MEHLVNAMATFATKLFDTVIRKQGEVGCFDRQAAQIARFGGFISHLRTTLS